MIRPRSHFEPISRPGQSWENRGDSLRLDMNELVPDVGEAVFAAVVAQMRPWMFSAYPEVNALYRDLASYLNHDVEHIVLTGGSDAGIRQTIETFCDPGDELLITYPTYR
jgi:histidinol-phosphate aminotransferase